MILYERPNPYALAFKYYQQGKNVHYSATYSAMSNMSCGWDLGSSFQAWYLHFTILQTKKKKKKKNDDHAACLGP